VRTTAPLPDLRVRVSALTPERLARLRHADAIVRRLSHASGFDRRIWQFPVVLIPLGGGRRPGLRGPPSRRFRGRHDRPVGRHAPRLTRFYLD
jgi:GMP synthase PP-ATPase subunit